MYGFNDSPDTQKIFVKIAPDGTVTPMTDDDVEVVLDDDRYPLDEDDE